MVENKERKELKEKLVQAVVSLGFPAEFGVLIGEELGTEKTLRRMLGYLRQAKPARMEDVADEMIAILEERQRWIDKKIYEHNNIKMNELMLKGIDEEED